MTAAQDPLAIAQALIRCRSITPADDGAQRVLKDCLTALGFTIFDLPFEGRDSYKVENFFARRGAIGPHLCFAGHTDVVHQGDDALWAHPPFEGAVKDGRLIGRGASDMKGQIAAFIAALARYIETEHGDDTGSISLLITGDEEKDAVNGTSRVLEWMADNNHMPDVCLVGEPSNPKAMGDEIKIGRRGSLSGYITVTGQQGHVAYPDLADNPLPRLIRALDALTSAIFDKGSAFFPQTNLEITTIDVGNAALNVIPGQARAAFNIRFSDRWTTQTLSDRVRHILAANAPDATLDLRPAAESFLTAPGEWTSLVSGAVESVTGRKPVLTTGGGTSDARFFAGICPVVECGMVNKTIHKVDESCDLADLEQCTSIYHEILKRYFFAPTGRLNSP